MNNNTYLVVYRQPNMRDPDGEVPMGTFVFEDREVAKNLMDLLNKQFFCEAIIGSPSR